MPSDSWKLLCGGKQPVRHNKKNFKVGIPDFRAARELRKQGGEESAISGSGKRDAGLREGSSPRQALTTSGRGDRDAGSPAGNSTSECETMDRNQPSEGQGTGMPACDQAAAAARVTPRAGGGHVGQRGE